MRKMRIVILTLCMLSGAGISLGAVIPLSINPLDLSSMGSMSAVPGWNSAMTTLMIGQDASGKDVMKGEVVSLVLFDNVNRYYYYLYQIDNIGDDASWHMIEVLTLTPFIDADASTSVGYLVGSVPSSFVSSGTEIPAGCSVNTDTGPTISFVFPGYMNPNGIIPGETSKVLYVKSTRPPQEIIGNIIDGAIADGVVIGPVPEPMTIILVAMGGAVLFGYKPKKVGERYQ